MFYVNDAQGNFHLLLTKLELMSGFAGDSARTRARSESVLFFKLLEKICHHRRRGWWRL